MPLKRDPSLIPLSHDHHHGLVRVFEIRQALRSAEEAKVASQRGLTRAFLASDLAPHFRAEEEVLFPVLLESSAVDAAVVQRLIDDHRALERFVADLDADRQALVAFADLLEVHIRLEERDVFAAYQERVAAARRAEVEVGIRRILGR